MTEAVRRIGWLKWSADDPYHHCIRRNTPMDVIVHGHDYYEVLIMFSGNVIQVVNQVKMCLQSGEMLIMRPGDTHAALPDSVPDYLFSMQICADEMELFMRAYGVENLKDGDDRQYIFRLSDRLAHEMAADCSLLMSVADKVERRFRYKIILGRIMEGCLASYVHEDVPPWLKIALSGMTSPENMAEGVPALLRLCWMSHSQVCRLMKKYYGVTPQQYIQNLRMNAARNLVESTTKDFETIAQEVGLSNMNHFHTVFKQTFGITLSEMRHQSNMFRAMRHDEP